MSMISKEPVNTGRQKEFDWAKSFTIIVMLCIHVYEQLSEINVETCPDSVFRTIMEFLAGPLGAPLFMFSMGLGIIYSRSSTPKKMVRRGLILLRNGYLLSFFKGTVPVLIGIMIGASVPITIADSLFLISILQFAGMAFLTIALMKKMKLPLYAMLIVSLVLSVAGTFLAKIDFTGSCIQYLLGLFFVTNDVTTFPLFLWLFYPVAGMIYAFMLQRVSDKKSFCRIVFAIGIAGTIIVSIIYKACGIDIRTMFMLKGRVFYNQTILHYIFTTFIIMIAMPVYYFLSEKITNKYVTSSVAFLGKNLDVIYIVQWLVIAYTQAFMLAFDLPKIKTAMIIPTGIVMLLISAGITGLWVIRKNWKKQK